MAVSMSRFSELLDGPSSDRNSNPTERQLAFYTAVQIKLYLQQNPQHCFDINNSSSGNPRAYHLSRPTVIQAAVSCQIPPRIAQQASFLADCRACLVFLNVIDRDNGLIMINNPTLCLNATNFSASNSRNPSTSSEVARCAGHGTSDPQDRKSVV